MHDPIHTVNITIQFIPSKFSPPNNLISLLQNPESSSFPSLDALVVRCICFEVATRQAFLGLALEECTASCGTSSQFTDGTASSSSSFHPEAFVPIFVQN